MNHSKRTLAGLLFLLLWMTGCSSPSSSPLTPLIRQLPAKVDASILLEDMKQDGVFLKEGFHKYRIVTPEGGTVTDWIPVSPAFYTDNENNLGMTLYSRVGSKENDSVAPPGYAYVGNPEYGQWRQRSDGSSFWEFYGKYALLRSLFGGWYSPVGYRDYGMFEQYRTNRRPYYGSRNQYGTRSERQYNWQYPRNGTTTRSTTFGDRVNTRTQQKRNSFASKVKKRVGRTRVTSRGRGGGFGK